MSVICKSFSWYIFFVEQWWPLERFSHHCSPSWTASRLKAWSVLFLLSELRTRKTLLSRVLRREKPVCITKRPASNPPTYHRGPRVPARRSSSLFPSGVLATSFSSSCFFLESAAKNVTSRPGRASLLAISYIVQEVLSSRFCISFQLQHMPFSISEQSPRRVTQRCLSCAMYLCLLQLSYGFLPTILKRAHENFNIFKVELMESTIFFSSLFTFQFILKLSYEIKKLCYDCNIFIIIADKEKRS